MTNIDMSDNLERECGTAILSELCGQLLTRNQQSVRLFDQTRQSAEFYFRADQRGKPYIQNFQTDKRYYPLTAYCQAYGVDYKAAVADLSRQHYGVDLSSGSAPIVSLRQRKEPVLPPASKTDYLPTDIYQQCQREFARNGLYEYLRFTFGLDKAEQAFIGYRLGTSRRWRYLGYLATCLPQFDINGNLRQVKVMPFDAMNGRRVKANQSCEFWNSKSRVYQSTVAGEDKTYFAGKHLARMTGISDPQLQQCFFGEHLLNAFPEKKIALVEGESTAIVCSLIWPEYSWLATGGSNGCGWDKPEKFTALAGRKVVLWPDTGKLIEWSQKADSLRPLVASLLVSDYVQKNTPAEFSNVDLRDLLTRPCYVPTNSHKPVYGELLASVIADSYPYEWDDLPQSDELNS